MKKLTFIFAILMATTWAKAQQCDVLHTGVTENFYNVCCIDGNTILTCGQNGVILKSIDGGESWEEKYRKTGCKTTELSFYDKNIGYAVCDSALDDYSHQWFLVKTNDGGETWNEVGEPVFSWIESYTALGNQFIRTEVFPIDADNLVVAVSFDGIYKSTDGGLTMRKLANDFTVNETRGLFLDENVGYLVWGYGEEDFVFPGERFPGLAKTEDYGETWTLMEDVANITDDMAFARFYDKNHIRLFGNFYTPEYGYKSILETHDGFDTFEATGYGSFGYLQFAEFYLRAKFTGNGKGVSMHWENDMPGVGRSVSYTEDDGLSWTSYSGYDLPSYRLYDIDGIDTTFFISCENGIVLKNRQFTLMGTEENSSYAATICPNPAKDAITISGEDISVVELYSSLGVCLVKKEMDTESGFINIQDFATGIYYVRIINGQGKSVTKMLMKK